MHNLSHSSRRFDKTFRKQVIPNITEYYCVNSMELSCIAEWPNKQVFISLDAYQLASDVKLQVLLERVAKYQIEYRVIRNDWFIDEKSIKNWFEADKKPYASELHKAKRMLLSENLRKLLRLPHIWLYGLQERWSDETIEYELDRDPDEQWREDMAELERFEMLGF